MKISIIGAGNIGGTLGKKWAPRHEVTFGVRRPADEKFDDLRSMGTVMSIAEALASAEVVLLAQPGAAVPEFAAEHGSALAGRIVIDSTNNIRSAEMNNLTVLKEKAPNAYLMRAFSTLGWENFANPKLGGETIDLFYCGHASSRAVVDQLVAEIGLRPVYLGELDAAPILDGLTRLWFSLAFGQGKGRRIALKLLDEK